jgi:hypothetical protein
MEANMNDDIVGTIVLTKMLGGRFRTVLLKADDPTRCHMSIDLYDSDRVVWRLIYALDVLREVDMTDLDTPCIDDYAMETSALYEAAKAGDESVYRMGFLTEMEVAA